MLRGHKLEPRPVNWLCRAPEIPAGMLTLVAGRPGQGKSMFTKYLAAVVTRQGERVIVSNQEEALLETLVPSLEAAGVDMRRCFMADPEAPYIFPRDCERLERFIKQTGAKLFVADAVVQHLSVSIYSDQECRMALTPLAKVLERTGCAGLLVTHMRKARSASAHPLESIAGSGAGLVAAARLVYIFGPSPKDPEARILAPVKSNIGKVGDSTEFAVEEVDWFPSKKSGKLVEHIARLKLISNYSSVPAAAVVHFNGGRKPNAVEEATDPTRLAMAEEWLTGLLKDGPRKVAEVESEGKKVKLSWATIRRASVGIEVKKERKGYGKGGFWQWDLPNGHPLKKAREEAEVAEATEDLDAELSELLAGGGEE
jgi:hypothetical protein